LIGYLVVNRLSGEGHRIGASTRFLNLWRDLVAKVTGASGSSLREAQKQLTLDKLIEAARGVFHSKGYNAATIDDIVDAAGASRGTFYLYFHSKGEVLGKIFAEEHIESVLSLLESFPATITGASLEEWIGQYLDLYQRDRLTIRAWIQAGSREAELRASSLAMMDRVLDSLAAKVLSSRKSEGLACAKKEARIRSLLMFVQMQEIAYYRYIREYPVNNEMALMVVADSWYYQLTGRAFARASAG
jgi:AcrR family transcriptional regulator